MSATTTARPSRLRQLFIDAIEWTAEWGKVIINAIIALGEFALFCFQTVSWLVTRVPKKETLLPNFYQVGVLSLPVVALTGTFIGMVLAVHSYAQFAELNLETQLGAVINMSLVRELGPVLAAVMLAGRVGSAMAAELGTMRVTEQIDALTSMGSNPIHYLVVPRLLSCVFLIPTLTIMADFMGVAGGYIYSIYIFEIDTHHYLSNSASYVHSFDIFAGVLKSLFFGIAISMVACFQGFSSGPGAEGVGKAATSSFVYSFVLILVIDLFLGIMLDSIYRTIFPQGPQLV